MSKIFEVSEEGGVSEHPVRHSTVCAYQAHWRVLSQIQVPDTNVHTLKHVLGYSLEGAT
jgi:hypothetical protein